MKSAIILIFYIVNSLQSTLYVKLAACSGSRSCDGSLENPFPDLRTAFDEILNGKKDDQFSIEVLDEVMTEPFEASKSPSDGSTNKKYIFSDISLIRISGVGEQKTRITFLEEHLLSLIVKNTTLVLRNLKLQGNSPYKDSFSEKFINEGKLNPFNKGLFNLLSPVTLLIENCEFNGIFSYNSNNNLAFHCLIYCSNPSASDMIKISITNMIITGASFYQGIILTDNNINDLTPLVGIEIKQMKIFETYSTNFPRWIGKISMSLAGPAYYDFLFILRNTVISISDSQIMNSARILLATQNCHITIKNLNYNKKIPDGYETAPDFIYLLFYNILIASDIQISDSKIQSYDDVNGANNRDFTFVNQMYMPSTLLDFERNQAVFMFGRYNSVTLQRITIKDTSIIKKENFLMAIFFIEIQNEITVTDMTVKSLRFDSESFFGLNSIIHISIGNALIMNNIVIEDLSILAFSSAVGIFSNIGNSIKISGLKTYKTIFRLKSNVEEVFAAYNNVFTDSFLYFNKLSADLKFASFIQVFINNEFAGVNFLMDTLYCLSGGLINAFRGNTISLSNSYFKSFVADFMSSTITLGVSNFMLLDIVTIENCKSFTGVIFSLIQNYIKMKNSSFRDNGSFGNYFLNALWEAGFYVGFRENTLETDKCAFSNGKADNKGGVISIEIGNRITFLNTDLYGNTATKGNSQGGAIYMRSNNIFICRNCFLARNDGSRGGVIFSEDIAIITIEDSDLFINEGLEGTVLNVIGGVVASFRNIVFRLNEGRNYGGMFWIDERNQINFENCTFYNNMVRRNRPLIQANFYNEMSFLNIKIYFNFSTMYPLFDNDTISVGWGQEFLFAQGGCKIFFKNISVSNMNESISFLRSGFGSDIKIEGITFENLKWKSIFFFTRNNIVSIINMIVLNSKMETEDSTVNGMFQIESHNTFNIYNISFSTCELLSPLFYFLVTNTIKIRQLTMRMIKFTNIDSTAFLLIGENMFDIQDFKAIDLEGMKNTNFLWRISKTNTLILNNVSFQGFFKFDEGEESSIILDIEGPKNIISFDNLKINIENPELNKKSDITFLKSAPVENNITLQNSAITTKRLFQIFLILGRNTISFKNIQFKQNLLIGGLLSLFDNARAEFVDVKFSKNIVKDTEFQLKFVNLCKAAFIKIIVDNNNNFIHSNLSNIYINSSDFINVESRASIPTNNIFLVYGINQSNISIKFAQIINRRSNKSSSIVTIDKSSIKIEKSFLGFNQAGDGGFIAIRNQGNLSLVDNKIISNTALKGGVMSLNNFKKVSVFNNHFIRNSADGLGTTLGRGGIAYADKTIDDFYILELENNKFDLTLAGIGGILFLKNKIVKDYAEEQILITKNKIRNTRVKKFLFIFFNYLYLC